MSLVNDMLRDLDARRRDTPARGIGAEKLVPAAEQSSAATKRAKPFWLWLVLPVLLLAAVTGYLLVGRDDGQLPPVVLSPPVAQTQPASRPVSAVDDAPALEAAVGIELAEMSARLRELEAQNQALLRAQQNQVPAPVSGSSQSGAADPEQSAWQPREWTPQADAEAEQATLAAVEPEAGLSAGEQMAQAATPEAAPRETGAATSAESSVPTAQPGLSVSTVRSPREMSFAERDRQVVQQALEQWNGGQQLAALQALDTFTYEFPEAHMSREMLAKLLIQQGEPERAMQVVDLGLTIAPRRNGYKKVKARLLLNQGQASDAVTLLSLNRPSAADDVEYHDLLATGLLSSAVYEEAALTYQALLAIDNQPGRWWYGLAAALDAQGQSGRAAQAYEQALRREDLGAALRQGSQQRLQALRQALP